MHYALQYNTSNNSHDYICCCCCSAVCLQRHLCEQRHFCVGKGSRAPAAGGPQQEGLKPLVRCMQVGGVEAPPTPVHWTSQIAEGIWELTK